MDYQPYSSSGGTHRLPRLAGPTVDVEVVGQRIGAALIDLVAMFVVLLTINIPLQILGVALSYGGSSSPDVVSLSGAAVNSIYPTFIYSFP